MARYAISGVWKENDTITDYAIHLVADHTIPGFVTVYGAEKYSKAEAIELVRNHFVQTAVWNYTRQFWDFGAEVKVVGNYLRTERDGTVRDNLDNLLNYRNITVPCN